MSNEELRQEYRLTTHLPVFIEIDNEQGDPTLVISHSIDISANGLRLISERYLTEGNILRTHIQVASADRRFLLMTEVKWCLPWKNAGEYLVGLSLFESEDTDIQRWKEFVAQACLSDLDTAQ